MYALNLDSATGRILSATFPEYAAADNVIVDDLPEGDISDYLYQDGAYIYDPLPKPVEPEDTEDGFWDELDAAYQEGVDSV